MNILISFQQNSGAGPACAYEWAKGFIQNNCQVYVIMSEDVVNLEDWYTLLEEQNICLLESVGKNRNYLCSIAEFYLSDKKKIISAFGNKEFDILLHTLYSNYFLFIDPLIHSKKIVTLCHDPIMHSGASKIVGKFYKRYIKKSSDVFVLSKSFKSIVAEKYNVNMNQIHYIPHGRMSMYHSNNRLYELQKEYKKKYHFMFFGRIAKYKGLHILAAAYNLLTQEYNDVELTILGNGDFSEYQDEYQKLKNVHVINRFIDDDEIGNYFSLNNTIVVVPYTDATQSGVIPIAFEFGTPIIASNTGGLMEQLNNGSIGILYRNNNPKELYECMKNFIENPRIFNDEEIKMTKHKKTLEWDVIAKDMLQQLDLI